MKLKRLQPSAWFTGEDPGPSFLDLPDDVLELVIQHLIDSHDITINSYSRHWLDPFLPAVLCRRLRSITLSRGGFWSTLQLSWHTTHVEPELVETIVSRSKAAPLHVHMNGLNDNSKALEVARNVLQGVWSRVARLSMNRVSFKGLLELLKLDTDSQPHSPDPNFISDLHINDHNGLLDIRQLVGPRITRISLHSVIIDPQQIFWMLGQCRSLQYLSLRQINLRGAMDYVSMMDIEEKNAATLAGRHPLLRHLEVLWVSALASIIAMIQVQFPCTIQYASCINIKSASDASTIDVETKFAILNLAEHRFSEEATLEWRGHSFYGECYCFCNTDGRLLRRSCIGFNRNFCNPGPLRAGILSVLQHIARLSLEFTSVWYLFLWVDAWRGESLPNLRYTKIDFRTEGRLEQEGQFLPIAADTPPIHTPQLQSLDFRGRVGWDQSDARYYSGSPLVMSWARFCAAVVKSFASSHEIAVAVSSTREFVVSSQALQEGLASVMGS